MTKHIFCFLFLNTAPSNMTSTSILSIPDEDINFDLVYALHNFVATVEGQVSVVKGDALILVDDSNAYWWLIKVLKSSQVGYLPAENIETPFERLSRLNKHKNAEMVGIDSHPTPWLPKHQQKKVRLSGTVRVQSHWTCEEEGVWRDTYTEHEKPLPPMAQDHWVRESTLSAHSPKNDEKEKKKTDVFWRLFSRGKGDRNSIDDREQFMQPILKEEKEKEEELSSVLRVYAGNLHVGVTYNSVLVTKNMCAEEMLMQAMERFHISQIEAKAMRKLSTSGVEYYLSLASVDHEEIILSPEDKPLAMFKSLTNHFTTPMPSLHHFKQCSHHLNAADFSPNRTSSRQKTKKQEECSIRFYLHKRIRSVNEREEQLHVKITYLPSRMSKRIGLEVCPERIDKIIAMPKKATVHECIRIACNKFHLTLGNEETFQRQEMPCFTLTEADKGK
ncbi:hypothetical protein BDF14DRAFT_1872902 [Spinellus fusiger]|nr:hypothetical protein BDF14DRAFT_1872902 [Spinellus fusiger]